MSTSIVSPTLIASAGPDAPPSYVTSEAVAFALDIVAQATLVNAAGAGPETPARGTLQLSKDGVGWYTARSIPAKMPGATTTLMHFRLADFADLDAWLWWRLVLGGQQGAGVTVSAAYDGGLSGGGGSGTVTSVGVVTANGLAGTVANATTTPAITLSCPVVGLLKSDGTTISAATAGTDYQTTNQTITLSGDASGMGTTSITVSVNDWHGTPFAGMSIQAASAVAITGGSITGMPNPTNGSDVATKAYVDALTTGLTFKPPACLAATTANLAATYANGSSGVGATLTNSGTQVAFTIDGVSFSGGERVLIKNQSTQAQNGIYTVTTLGSGSTNWVLTRTTDFNQSSNIATGDYVVIGSGTANVGTLWVETGAGPFTVGTTAIVFTELTTAPMTVTLTGDTTGTGTGSITTTTAKVNGVSFPANPATNTVPVVTSTNTITYEALPNAALANSSITVTAGAGLSGGGAISLGGSATLSVATGGIVTSMLAANAVTNAKMATSASNTLAGYDNSGNFGDVTIGTGLSLSGGILASTGGSGLGTVTSISAGTGIACSPAPITTTGTVSLASIASDTVLANITAGSAAPIANTMTAILDACIGSTAGSLLFRGATAWALLQPTDAQLILGTSASGGIVAVSMSGDATITHSGVITVSKINGTSISLPLSVGNGGTGLNSVSLGDMVYGGNSNTIQKLSGNSTTTKEFLTSTGTGSTPAAPAWGTIAAADLPTTGLTITQHAGTITADTDGSTITFNLGTSDWHSVTLGGNRTLALTGAVVGQQFTLVLIQDGSGSRTVTWFTTIKWPGGSPPTLSTAPGAIDVFTFKCVSSGVYYGFAAGLNLS